MANTNPLRLPDGQSLNLYNVGNTKAAALLVNGSNLEIGSSDSDVKITSSNLIFNAGSSIKSSSGALNIGASGDTINLNIAGVTYKVGTLTGATTFTDVVTMNTNLTVSGALTPTTLLGTINATDAILSFSRDTDMAKIYFADYGANTDWLTFEFGDDATQDRIRFRTNTQANVLDIITNSVTSYVDITAPTFTEGSTLLSAKYLGISSQAVDSAKLGNVVAANYMRSDVDDTMGGILTISTNSAESLKLYRNSTSQNVGVNYTNTVSTIYAGARINSATDRYFAVGTSPDLSTATITMNADTGEIKVGGNKVWHAGNDGSGSGLDADTVDGIDSATMRQGRNANYYDFTVAGDANTYYPVKVNGSALYAFTEYSITRGYNWAAPDTWNTATHKGGLTFTFLWSGDTGWGGNDHSLRVIEFAETYCNMVAGMVLSTGGLLVWLRGGGAQYRLQTESGASSGVTVYDTTNYTAPDSQVYTARTSLSNVTSEIMSIYPVRGSGGLFVSNSAVWTGSNDGAGSGLDADLLDGLQSSSFLRSDTNTALTGNLAITGNIDVSGLVSISGASGTYREGQEVNYASRMSGRILNKNSDFIASSVVGTAPANNVPVGYAIHDNNNSDRVRIYIVSDDMVPNNTGKIMRISFDPARNASVATTPNCGGFKIDVPRTTGNPTTWGYRAGNRYLFRIIANIPSGRNLTFNSSVPGTGGGSKWLTSQAGTGNWQEYVMLITMGNTGTLGAVGAWSVDGAVTSAFTWDVSICQVIGVDEIPDVDRGPSLNVGYKNTDLGWGEIYSTGKITTDNNIVAVGSITGAGITSSNSLTVSAGDLNISTGVIRSSATNAGVELGSTTTANTPFIDFHSSGGTEDYSSRIIASGGTAGTVGSGTLTLGAANTIISGSLTVNKVSNVSTITFPAGAGGNDPGYIKHIETTVNQGIMQFSVSDDSSDTDYFSFGGTPSGTYTEGAKISSAGNTWFKSTNVTSLTSTGQVQLATGSDKGIKFIVTDATNGDKISRIETVAGNNVLIRSDELRLGTSASGWDYNSWAGIKYNHGGTPTMVIGGPTAFINNTGASRITLSFAGTDSITMDGKVTINPTNAGNINKATMANGNLLLGSIANGLAFDTDEIMSSGSPLYIGTIGANNVLISPNGTDVATVSTTGVSIAGTLSVSSNVSVTGTTTSGKAKIGTSSSYTTYALFAHSSFDTSTGYALMQDDSGLTILNAETAKDLVIRIGNADKMRIKGDTGRVGIGTISPSYPLHVVGDVYATAWLRSGGATGWYNETYSGGWYMTDATWIKNYGSKAVYINALTRSDSLQVGSTTTYTAANDFQWSGGILNHRNTLWANNVGVAVGKTSLSSAVLDVYTTSAAGINLQRSAETLAPGISFQNSGAAGKYTAWIAPTASATPDLVVYAKGTSDTLDTANMGEVVRFKNDGNTEVKGNIIFSGGAGAQSIRKVHEISFDWTGAYDNAAEHGIQSKGEDGSKTDALRINSYSDIILTVDSNANSSGRFVLQKESTTNGTDLITVDESANTFIYGRTTISTDRGETPTYSGGHLELKNATTNSTNDIVLGFHRIGLTASSLMHTGDTWGSGQLALTDTSATGRGSLEVKRTHFRQASNYSGFTIEHNPTEDSLDFIYQG